MDWGESSHLSYFKSWNGNCIPILSLNSCDYIERWHLPSLLCSSPGWGYELSNEYHLLALQSDEKLITDALRSCLDDGFLFTADFMFLFVKWLESYKSYITALPGTWNVHVASDACQKSRLRIWYFLDRLFEVFGLQLKNERHNLCLWAIGSPYLVAMQMLCLLFGMLKSSDAVVCVYHWNTPMHLNTLRDTSNKHL